MSNLRQNFDKNIIIYYNMIKIITKLEKIGGWLWIFPEHLQEKAEMWHNMWLEFLSEAVKERHDELIKVRKSVREWAESPEMAEFSKKARKRYLISQLRSATAEFEQNRERYVELVRSGQEAQNCVVLAEKLARRINGYKTALDIHDGKISAKYAITDEMIEAAREYPIEKLVEIGHNGRSRCVFHQGEGFNMDIRKNYAYCYVCGDSGDAIKVYMALHGVGFKEAVLFLSKY